MSDPRPLRQIDAVTAQVDQLHAELESLSRQLMLLLLAGLALSFALGLLLLWPRK